MNHVYAALETLSSFCKTQQKIIIRRNKEKKASTSTASLAPSSCGDSVSVPLPGGINDVD
jgi:hypothetical protein